MTIPKSPLVLGALALAAYFLFFKKSGSAATVPSSAPSVSNANPADAAINAATNAASELLKWGGGKAKEALAMDGMAHASLNGTVASVGGYGELGGSFYGGY